PIQLEDIAKQLDQPSRIFFHAEHRHGGFARLSLYPCEEVLAEEEKQKDHQPKSVDEPKELAAQNHAHGHASDGPDGAERAAKAALPGSIVQQFNAHRALSPRLVRA